MELILKKEFMTKEELDAFINSSKCIDVSYRYAVVGLITDTNGDVIIPRRGDMARDGAGWLADIGGAYEEDDRSFRDALLREIHEEVGDDADIKIDDFICGVLKSKYDPKTEQEVNWIFLTYKCTYYGGELRDNENGKIQSFEKYKMNELPLEKRLETSIFFWNYYMNEYNKCYSYAMGVEDKIKKLDKKKFNIKEDDGDYEVIFNKEYSELWEEFIINNMKDGFWNEYIVNGEIRFIFKNDDGTVDKCVLNKDNNQDILVKCRMFAETQFPSVKEMYINTSFYSDKITGIEFYD